MIGGDYEFWSRPDAMATWQARCEAARAEADATGKTAMERGFDKIDVVAPGSVRSKINHLARGYRDHPLSMCSVDAKLVFASPRKMLAIVEHHLDLELRRRRRFIGMGGEVPLLNAKAVRLAARWRRRFERDDYVMLAAAE